MLRGLFVRFMSLYLRVCVAYHVQMVPNYLVPNACTAGNFSHDVVSLHYRIIPSFARRHALL